MHRASGAAEPTDTTEGLLREWSVLVRTIERAPGKTVHVGPVTIAHLHKSAELGDAWAELDGECGSGSKRTVVLVRLNEGVVQVINRARPHVQEVKSAANPKDLLKRIAVAITDTHAGTRGSGAVQAAAEPSVNPDSVRTDMYFYLAENAQQVKFRYGAVHGAGHEIYYATCFARSSTVLVLRYQHMTAEHIHSDLDVNVSTHGHVFVVSSGRDRVQVRIQGDMESLAGAVVRAGAQLLLHKLKTGWSSETAEAAAEPSRSVIGSLRVKKQDPHTWSAWEAKQQFRYILTPTANGAQTSLPDDPLELYSVYRNSVIDGLVNTHRVCQLYISADWRCYMVLSVSSFDFGERRNNLISLGPVPTQKQPSLTKELLWKAIDKYAEYVELMLPGLINNRKSNIPHRRNVPYQHADGVAKVEGGAVRLYVRGEGVVGSIPLRDVVSYALQHGLDMWDRLITDTLEKLLKERGGAVRGAVEPAADARAQISREEMKELVQSLTFHKSFQLAGYTVTLTPDHVDDAFHVIFERDKKKMCFLVLRYLTGHVRVSNISAANAHIRRRVELAHVPLEVTAFLRMVLRACLDLAAVAFDKYAREHG